MRSNEAAARADAVQINGGGAETVNHTGIIKGALQATAASQKRQHREGDHIHSMLQQDPLHLVHILQMLRAHTAFA